jgi:hypothetical protein
VKTSLADDDDRQRFLKTLAAACDKTAWEVHAHASCRTIFTAHRDTAAQLGQPQLRFRNHQGLQNKLLTRLNFARRSSWRIQPFLQFWAARFLTKKAGTNPGLASKSWSVRKPIS